MVLASARVGALVVFLAGCAWGALELYQTWEADPARLRQPAPAPPIKQILFATDGVLDRAWIDGALALPRGTSLMTLDMAALEKRLLASGQVQSVVLRRRFADNTLLVDVRERTPVARMMVQADGTSPRLLLVARDGGVYRGHGYGASALERLPWLDGVALRRTPGGGFGPIEGMGLVAGLLDAAEGLVPQLRAGWDVVSLARMADDQEIVVRSREIPEVIFAAGDDYGRQLAKLDYIIDTLRSQGSPPIQRIDLALGGQVPVALQDTPRLTPPATAAPRAPSPFQPRPRRDF